jgi:hypothetical protein
LPGTDLSRLRSRFQPSPGLRVHDWGEATAVVFVSGRGDTHLIDGEIAGLLTDWLQDEAGLDPELVGVLDAQCPALVQAGILQPLPA